MLAVDLRKPLMMLKFGASWYRKLTMLTRVISTLTAFITLLTLANLGSVHAIEKFLISRSWSNDLEVVQKRHTTLVRSLNVNVTNH